MKSESPPGKVLHFTTLSAGKIAKIVTLDSVEREISNLVGR